MKISNLILMSALLTLIVILSFSISYRSRPKEKTFPFKEKDLLIMTEAAYLTGYLAGMKSLNTDSVYQEYAKSIITLYK